MKKAEENCLSNTAVNSVVQPPSVGAGSQTGDVEQWRALRYVFSCKQTKYSFSKTLDKVGSREIGR